jgi:hypothetical protein
VFMVAPAAGACCRSLMQPLTAGATRPAASLLPAACLLHGLTPATSQVPQSSCRMHMSHHTSLDYYWLCTRVQAATIHRSGIIHVLPVCACDPLLSEVAGDKFVHQL